MCVITLQQLLKIKYKQIQHISLTCPVITMSHQIKVYLDIFTK